MTESSGHSEHQYLDALRDILAHGERKANRTGIETRSLFGLIMRFDLRDGFPLLTTKRMPFRTMIRELLFFLRGETQTRKLEEQGVRIWHDNTTRTFLDARGLHDLEEGDMGKMYGYQWRHWGGTTEDSGIDQIDAVVASIKSDPWSRRHVVSAWNVSQLGEMALPPCHVLFQFNVSSDHKYLDLMLYQRSGDMFLGVPFNIASYAALLTWMASMTDLTPRHLVHTIGDAHIYATHEEAVRCQLERECLPWPTLRLRQPHIAVDHLDLADFELTNYTSHPSLSAPMAV